MAFVGMAEEKGEYKDGDGEGDAKYGSMDSVGIVKRVTNYFFDDDEFEVSIPWCKRHGVSARGGRRRCRNP